jgi:hypothetical protein
VLKNYFAPCSYVASKIMGACGSGSWLRYFATSRKIAGSIPDVTGFFSCPNPFSRTMALSSTQPPREMNTRNLPGGKRRPASKADNLTAIGEPIA